MSVRHHKASQQLLMVCRNKLGSRRRVEEAGDNFWEAHPFLSQLRSLKALLSQCCCGISVDCSCSQASLSPDLLSAQLSAPPVKPSNHLPWLLLLFLSAGCLPSHPLYPSLAASKGRVPLQQDSSTWTSPAPRQQLLWHWFGPRC